MDMDVFMVLAVVNGDFVVGGESPTEKTTPIQKAKLPRRVHYFYSREIRIKPEYAS
jgi:hypothetical protein